ncbi:zinc ribbon domain-containing protein [Mycoplasmatota bacterium WC30]
MKKGIISAIIGLMAFIFIGNILMFSFADFGIAFTIGPIFSISVFILIIVVFIKLAKKQQENQVNHPTQSNHHQRKSITHCVKCNALIEGDDRYCPECGASQRDTIICEYCGHENPKSNALCEKCNGFL